MTAYAKLDNAAKQVLAELYAGIGKTVDELPYTDDFERLYAAFTARTGRRLTRHEFWRVLSGARKARRLTRKRR